MAKLEYKNTSVIFESQIKKKSVVRFELTRTVWKTANLAINLYTQ